MRHRAMFALLAVAATAAASDRVVEEMARRTRLSVNVIEEASTTGCESGNQSLMNLCMQYQFVGSDLELNDAYQLLVRSLREQDAKNALIKAQRSWIEFRDAHCQFDSVAWAGGSARQMAIASCLKGTTEDRTKQLKGYLACSSPDCPPLLQNSSPLK